MIRVLLADDHAILRDGLRALLRSQEDIEVVGEAGDGREALEQVERLRPDVMLLDLSMPGLNGIEALRRVKSTSAATRVLVLSMHSAAEYVRPALAAGAAGYVVKGAGLDDLIVALRTVAAGERFLGPEATRVVDAGAMEPAATDRDDLERLTPREREVLQLVAEGHTNREIGAILGCAPKTVDAHRTRLMQKLDLHDAQAVTRYALRRGMISTE